MFCKGSGGCLAGNGDDDFDALEIEEIYQMIDSGYHARLKRNLTNQELNVLTKVINNGYSRARYITIDENYY